MRFFYTILLVAIQLTCLSQDSKDSVYTAPETKSRIVDHSGVQRYIENHKVITVKKNKPFTEGFRIQIFNGNNKDDANRIKADFYSKFPDMRCYLTYQQPYYKVRVGDYYNQEMAKPDLRKMAKYYPSSFLVPDQIRQTEKEKEASDDDKKKEKSK